MKPGRSVYLLLALYVLSILIRLPQLDRPLSKHHEFNTAVILLGLESWKQGGGAENFNYIPLLTYQNPADKLLEKGPYVDKKGNLTYLSFGPGWYVIPYFVFNLFKIPPTPLALQILNLFFLLASVLLLYRFVNYLFLKAGYEPSVPSLAACFVFLFNPSILWFLGNGYITSGIVLPFLIIILHYGIKMMYENEKNKIKTLGIYFAAGICAIYIDWYGVFFLSMICFVALLKIRQDKKYRLIFTVSFFAIVFGILLILFQFASYTGWQAVYDYWTSRYMERGMANPQMNKVDFIVRIFKHLGSGFLPLFIALVIGFIIAQKKLVRNKIPQQLKLALVISLVGCLLDSIILLNWTGVHDFAVIPYSIILSLIAGWIVCNVSRKHILWLAVFTFIATLAQYYYINYPGKKTMKGLPYNSYQKIAAQINQVAGSDERIFCNTSYMIYSFYAKRNFTNVSSFEEAIGWARKYGVSKGVWIKIHETDYKIVINEIKHFQ